MLTHVGYAEGAPFLAFFARKPALSEVEWVGLSIDRVHSRRPDFYLHHRPVIDDHQPALNFLGGAALQRCGSGLQQQGRL
jgi:hypothetical protein